MHQNNVISVAVPNVTGVPNVTSAQMYRKCPKIILVCRKCTKKPAVEEGQIGWGTAQLTYGVGHLDQLMCG